MPKSSNFRIFVNNFLELDYDPMATVILEYKTLTCYDLDISQPTWDL